MLIVAFALLACPIAVVGVLLFWSYPGRPRPFVDGSGRPLPGSISEKVYVSINGVEQGMFIKGKDKTNPVLLYLHGGMPDYFLAQRRPTGIEELFTVVWWEQRGSGLSYRSDIPRESMALDQLIADTVEVTNYLRRRFNQERIYLMGHSGGTFLGMKVVARAPQLYLAYVGVAQMSDQRKSEKLAYDYMLERYRQLGDESMVRRLEAAPVTLADGVPRSYLLARDQAMHGLGIGTTHDMRSVVTGLFLPSLQSREYTLREKLRMWRGKASSGVSCMWNEMLATDLATGVPEVAIPVYFLHGVYDYTCSYSLAQAYFGELRAPVKGFYTFAQSAHSPLFEEPDKAREILREDVLAGANRLADRK